MGKNTALLISSCKRRGMTDQDTELFLAADRETRITMLADASERQNDLYSIPPVHVVR